jgi:hypothetical protein
MGRLDVRLMKSFTQKNGIPLTLQYRTSTIRSDERKMNGSDTMVEVGWQLWVE